MADLRSFSSLHRTVHCFQSLYLKQVGKKRKEKKSEIITTIYDVSNTSAFGVSHEAQYRKNHKTSVDTCCTVDDRNQ